MHRYVYSAILAATLSLGIGGAKAQDIPIAVVGPVTGSNAALGEQMTRGAKMAVADINAKGGVLGKKLNLIIADDACDPKQAVAAANDVVGKKVVFVAGHYCSSSSIPASASTGSSSTGTYLTAARTSMSSGSRPAAASSARTCSRLARTRSARNP